MVSNAFTFGLYAFDGLTAYYGGNQVRMVTELSTTDYGHPAEKPATAGIYIVRCADGTAKKVAVR